ncbi:MAG: 3-oxoadipate enol-lactonase, partial [Pseudomonadota bacterium]
MQFATINDTTMRYRVEGDPHGPAIVFANSLGTDLTLWDAVIARLPKGYRMVGYDKRGHGLSSLPEGEVTVDELAADLLALMDHLGIAEAVLCGVSVGGMIVQRAASLASERVRGLVLCNTGARIGSEEMWAERMALLARDGLDAQADAIMERWFTAPFRASRPDAVAGYRAMLTRTPLKGYLATCAALRDADLTQATRSLTTHALCIAGAGDLATPPNLVRALADLMPGAVYREIAECGHIPSVEQPEACAEAITAFLDALDDSAEPLT